MLTGTASSTNNLYASKQRCFLRFCAARFLPPLPAGEVSHLLPYTALLASQGLHRSTISSHLAAIRHYSIINGHGDPTKEALMLGYARKGAASSSLPSPLREAVTLPTLLDFLSRLDLHSYDDSLFFAMASLAFFAFLRISEYTLANRFDPDRHLTWGGIVFTGDGLTVHLRCSKGDRLRDGVTIHVGWSSSPVCAVSAMLHYRRITSSLAISTLPQAPLFTDATGHPINPTWFADKLKQEAFKSGLRGDVTPHSLRIGAATTAWRAGFSDSQIQTLGRWKSDSFKKYLRKSSKDSARLSGRLGALVPNVLCA